MSLQDLRAKAHTLQAQADIKIAQIKAGTYCPPGADPAINNGKYGVDIAGTQYDPRKTNIDRMTTRQVEKHIERLENFNSNVVGYYRGARPGDIISKSAMASVRRAYRVHNAEQAAEHAEIGGTEIPGMGNITVEEYDHDFRPRRAYLESGTAPTYTPKALPVPTRYQSDKGARIMAEKMHEMYSTRGKKKRVENARQQIQQVIDRLDDPGDLQKILTLDDERLWFLWTSSSKFADTLSEMYFAQGIEDEPGRYGEKFEEMMIESHDENIDSLMSMYEEAYNVEFKPSPELAARRLKEKRQKAARKGLRTRRRNARKRRTQGR